MAKPLISDELWRLIDPLFQREHPGPRVVSRMKFSGSC
jgi:hypothetical protein